MAESDENGVAIRRRGRPKGDDILSREVILTTAEELAAETSLDKVSVRGIAARRGVSAMAIYNHVSGKLEIEQHLLANLFKSEARLVDLDQVKEGPDIIRAVFINQFNLALKHRDIFLVFTHHSQMPEVLQFQEQMYEGFRRCGLPSALHRVWARIFATFVNGSVALHNATFDSAWDSMEAAYLELDTQLYPNLAAARRAMPATPIALFEPQLDMLIDALLLSIKNLNSEPVLAAATTGSDETGKS